MTLSFEAKVAIMMLSAALLSVSFTIGNARSEDCPPSTKSCKVLVITAEEENALVTQNGVLATAAQARKLDLEGVVNYFFEKIKNAPAGTVKAEPPKTEQK